MHAECIVVTTLYDFYNVIMDLLHLCAGHVSLPLYVCTYAAYSDILCGVLLISVIAFCDDLRFVCILKTNSAFKITLNHASYKNHILV